MQTSLLVCYTLSLTGDQVILGRVAWQLCVEHTSVSTLPGLHTQQHDQICGQTLIMVKGYCSSMDSVQLGDRRTAVLLHICTVVTPGSRVVAFWALPSPLRVHTWLCFITKL